MRAARRGTIVLMSSLGGKVSVPFASPYCASKHALEAVADALRVETAPFGVRVVTVEPGPIDTRFADRARSIVGPLISKPGPYRAFYANAERAMDGDFRRGHLPPEAVARVVVDAIESPRPRTALHGDLARPRAHRAEVGPSRPLARPHDAVSP